MSWVHSMLYWLELDQCQRTPSNGLLKVESGLSNEAQVSSQGLWWWLPVAGEPPRCLLQPSPWAVPPISDTLHTLSKKEMDCEGVCMKSLGIHP